MSEARAPSGYKIMQAMSAAQAVRDAILRDDPDLAADEIAMRDLLDGETDVYDVLRRMVRFVLDAESLAAAANDRAEKLAARKARFEKRAQLGRGAVMEMLTALGERRFNDAEFTISIRAGSSSVFITDETQLPDAFVKIKREPMKTEIGHALKSGQNVPGAVLVTGNQSLGIKVT